MNNLSVINFGTSYGLKEGEAIIGFASFQDAVDFAEENHLKLATFKNEGNTSSFFTIKTHVQDLMLSATTRSLLNFLKEMQRPSKRLI